MKGRFTKDSLERVQSMLQKGIDWNGQFLTGRAEEKFPIEEKTIEAESLQGMDIDARPGIQKGDQGKGKTGSQSIRQVALPNANPQPGPRSLSSNRGLSMFEESGCPKPRKPQSQQAPKPLSEQPQNKSQGVTPERPPQPNKPADPVKKAERERKKQECQQRQGAGTGVTFEENCRPRPTPRSPEQRSATQQAQQASQQQGQTFDSMPQKEVQKLGRQGGQAQRQTPLPYCNK